MPGFESGIFGVSLLKWMVTLRRKKEGHAELRAFVR